MKSSAKREQQTTRQRNNGKKMSISDILTTAAAICFWEISFRVFKRVSKLPAVDKAYGGFDDNSETATNSGSEKNATSTTATTTRTSFAIFCNSTVHSSCAAIHAAIMAYTVLNSADALAAQEPHSRFRLHVLADLAYYIVDTFHEAREKASGARAMTLKSLFMLHHAPILAGYVFYIPWSSEQPRAAYFQTSLLMSIFYVVHASTPMQNLKWLMDKSVAAREWRTTALYRLNFVAFLASFALLRVYGIVPALRSVVFVKQLDAETTSLLDVATKHMPVKCVVCTSILYVLNLLWLGQNLRTAIKILFPRKEQ